MGKFKKFEYIFKSADSVHVGDKIWVYGKWLIVIKRHHLNRHPIQLEEIYVAEFREPIRVPAGWQIRTKVL